MPFGFQNAGAGLMNLILKEKISRNLEGDVDDLIVRDFENSYIRITWIQIEKQNLKCTKGG